MHGEQVFDEVELIVEKVWQEQLASFDQGTLIPSESFFERYPQLLRFPEAATDVIFNEFELHSRLKNERPSQTEFLDRFPDFRVHLERQFKVLLALESAELTSIDLSRIDEVDRNGHEATPLTLSRFCNREVIGQGATATVETAFDQQLQHKVALKRLHSHLRHSKRAKLRLRREAQTVARLHHPHIVPIHEILDTDDQVILVSRFVNGKNLRDLQETGAASDQDQIVEWVRQIADALHYSHENEVTHRDVKPSNILVGENGQAMLTDFGLASFSQSSGGITQTGEVLGTPAFMSPEQAMGDLENVDHRSDIYSLGATLYFLLCGRAPFQGVFATIVQQVISSEPPPLKKLNRNIHVDLVTIANKCLSKNREHRYATARDLAEDLRRFQNGDVIVARKTGPLERLARRIRRRPVFSASFATILLLAAFLSGTLLHLGEIRDQRNRAQQAEETNRKLLTSAAVDAGRLSLQKGDFDRAIDHFQTSLNQGVDSPAAVQVLLVEALMSKGDVQTAAERLRDAKSLDNSRVQPLITYWETELAALGHADFKTKAIDKEAFAALEPSKQKFFLGFNSANSVEALDFFNEAVAADPSHRNARRMSLIMALSLARFDEVLAGAKTAQQMYPDDIDFQLLEALSLACTDQLTVAKSVIRSIEFDHQENGREWVGFCEFLFQLNQEEFDDLKSRRHIAHVAQWLARFNLEFRKLLASRRWRFPPEISAKFAALTTTSVDEFRENDLIRITRELSLIHPESTLLIAAGDNELIGNHPRSQLEMSRDYFLQATTANTFAKASHDYAWYGLYGTSMAIYMLHEHELEKNREHMIQAARHLEPEWLSGRSKLRSMYIPLITIGHWDLAKPFIDRSVATAKTDNFRAEALWHLALWHQNRKDWSQVLQVCRRSKNEVSREYLKNSPEDWQGLEGRAVHELNSLLKD